MSLSPATTAAPPDTTLSARRLTAVVGVLSLAVFMSSLDLFIVNLAFPYIGREYAGTGLGSLSWILNGYTIVFAAVLVPAGRWADRVGRRKLFVAGLAAFVVGSLFCGLAPGVAALIAARVVQAAGAGLMVPASLSLLLAAVPAEARSRAIGTWSAIGALGAALGPVIGGSLVQFSWRWVFWINLPVGIVAILLASKVVPESKDDHVTGRPDVARRRPAGRGRGAGRAGSGQGAGLGMGLGWLRRPAPRVAGLRRGHGRPVTPAPLPGDRAWAAPLADLQRRFCGLDPLLRRVRCFRAQLGRVPDRACGTTPRSGPDWPSGRARSWSSRSPGWSRPGWRPGSAAPAGSR